jgi:hypothetical protein
VFRSLTAAQVPEDVAKMWDQAAEDGEFVADLLCDVSLAVRPR